MPRTTSSPRPRRPPPAPLNRDVILDAAIELIEHDGPSALSMRRLGSRLGVEGMAIYHHFAGRDELLSAIGDRLLTPFHALDRDGDIGARHAGDSPPRCATLPWPDPPPFNCLACSRLTPRRRCNLSNSCSRCSWWRDFTPGTALGIYRAIVSYARGYALAEATGFTVDAAHTAGRQRLRALPERCVSDPRRSNQGARRARRRRWLRARAERTPHRITGPGCLTDMRCSGGRWTGSPGRGSGSWSWR